MAIILLIFGIVYAIKIPKLLKSTPGEYPGCDPNIHARWRAKELGSIYAFLAATWGQMILFFFIGIAIAVSMNGDPEKLNSVLTPITVVEVIIFIGGLVWAAVLGSQAKKLKDQLGAMATTLPPSYYPRAGQQTLVAQPVSPEPPAPAPPAPPAPSAPER